jgi:hypothetical protein
MSSLDFIRLYLALPSFAAASACLASTSEVLAFLILDILLYESQSGILIDRAVQLCLSAPLI